MFAEFGAAHDGRELPSHPAAALFLSSSGLGFRIAGLRFGSKLQSLGFEPSSGSIWCVCVCVSMLQEAKA